MRYFVTGTDTGVGKTFVTTVLAERARRRGLRVFAWKPIETGCERVDDQQVGEDQEAISSDWQRGALRGLYKLIRPAAPFVAARAEGCTIDLDLIDRAFRHGAKGADLVIVEGAGGWRVPITEEIDMGGLARALDLPVVLVARATLGTINHTLLTLEAVRRDGAEIAAVVISCKPTDDGDFAKENAQEIQRRFPGQILLLQGDPAPLDILLPSAGR